MKPFPTRVGPCRNPIGSAHSASNSVRGVHPRGPSRRVSGQKQRSSQPDAMRRRAVERCDGDQPGKIGATFVTSTLVTSWHAGCILHAKQKALEVRFVTVAHRAGHLPRHNGGKLFRQLPAAEFLTCEVRRSEHLIEGRRTTQFRVPKPRLNQQCCLGCGSLSFIELLL